MGWSLAQNVSSFGNTASTVQTLAYPLAQSAASLNIVIVGWFGTAANGVFQVGDSVNGNYTQAGTIASFTSDISQAIYYRANIGSAGAGSNTVTASFNNALGGPVNLMMSEWQGAALSGVNDQNGNGSGNSATPTSATVTPVVGGELLIGGFTVYDNSPFTAIPGWTIQDTNLPNGGMWQWQIQGAAAAIAASVTHGSSNEWVAQIATFKVASVQQAASTILRSLSIGGTARLVKGGTAPLTPGIGMTLNSKHLANAKTTI